MTIVCTVEAPRSQTRGGHAAVTPHAEKSPHRGDAIRVASLWDDPIREAPWRQKSRHKWPVYFDEDQTSLWHLSGNSHGLLSIRSIIPEYHTLSHPRLIYRIHQCSGDSLYQTQVSSRKHVWGGAVVSVRTQPSWWSEEWQAGHAERLRRMFWWGKCMTQKTYTSFLPGTTTEGSNCQEIIRI